MKSVTVITPTIGKPELKVAIESVKKQTYPTTHLVVVDGMEYLSKTVNMHLGEDIQFCVTPEKTGANGFYGHRVYAAYPHLLNSDYILFLDEDNWFEPNHVEALVNTIEKNNLDFSYSLRRIHDKDGNYQCNDDCESLGKWEIFLSRPPYGKEPGYLVDTSSYCFTKDFIQKTCHIWHWGWGGDRRYFNIVRHHANYGCSGKYTLCYRLDGNQGSVTKDFFIEGNKIQQAYYGGKFPWQQI